MKSDGQISKPFLAIVILSLALTGIIAWFGKLHHGTSIPQTKTFSQTQTNAISEAAANAENSDVGNFPTDGTLPPVIPIPLKNVLVDAENGSWLRDKDYLTAPHTPQEFGGVEFLMDGMIQLQGTISRDWRKRNYRTNVFIPVTLTNSIGEIEQRGSNIASIHLLGGARYGENAHAKLADIVWHYTDGTTALTPVEYQNHVRDWVRNPYEQPDHLPYRFTKVVWVSPKDGAPGTFLRLYRATFPNPHPKKVIQQIELASAMEYYTLFVVGITLDPLKPGVRPDNSADLEPTDAVPPHKIQIYVKTTDGQPIANAQLQAQFQQNGGANQARTTWKIDTDGNGAGEIRYPPQGIDYLSVSASHDDYGGRKILWDLNAGDKIPESYTLKLSPDVKIGGIVVDENDSPISGAKVSLYRFWSSADDGPRKKGEQPDFQSQTATTDADGKWHAKGLPPTLLDNIGFNVTHPDYLQTNQNSMTVSASEEQLRAETFKTILHLGLDVRGLVYDDNNNPISGATVWAGKKYFNDRKQTKTDSNGQFLFHNIGEGDVVFSASAKGRAPDSKTISVKAGMTEIIFKLAAGHTIQGVVQDDSGTPISGVNVLLEGNGDIGRTYEFSTTTKADGRFVWDSAPADPMQFYFGKSGYADLRDKTLQPDQDNVVVMHKPRQLQGLVLDEDTGAPVTKFSVRTGHHDANQSDVYGIILNHDFSSPDGTFKLDVDQEDENAVAVWSDDYPQKVTDFPDAQNGIIQVTIRLKRGDAIQGVVTAPDGTPLPGVNVAATGNGGPNGSSFGVTIRGSHLQSWNQQSKVVTTDSDGKFTLPAAPENAANVVAAGDLGFANMPLDQIRSSGTIVLQPWGKIVGTLKIGGEPSAGKDLQIDVNSMVGQINMDWSTYKKTTDDNGAFMFDKVPPGDVSIVRLIQTSPNSWSHSYGKNVHVNPGQTVQVNLGDDGAVIKGSVRFEAPPANTENLFISGNLFSQPQQPSLDSSGQPRVFYDSSPKNFAVAIVVGADNTFTIDSVPPGNYTLSILARKRQGEIPIRPNVTMWNDQTIAQGQTIVTVPDGANPSSPISIGEILLKSTPQQ